MRHPNTILLILDGWGLYTPGRHNAISQAHLPTYTELINAYPVAHLEASGTAVGLPPGQIGTSEVNHLTIGAGRVLHQSLVRINQSIENGSFFKNPISQQACDHALLNNATLHLVGLYSSGGVHSHANHLHKLLELAQKRKVPHVTLHLFSDGRDVLPHSGAEAFTNLEKLLKKFPNVTIATVSGRYWSMDRDENWGRTNRAFEALTNLEGTRVDSLEKLFTHAYQNKLTDEYIEPCILEPSTQSDRIKPNDAVIFFNFRPDRMRQLTNLFVQKNIPNLFLCTMTRYQKDSNIPVLFETDTVPNHLVEILEKHAITHHHISETEKYAHVTYFFNGRTEEPYPHEKRLQLKSYSDIRSHDERPEMRAPDIAQAITTLIHTQAEGLIIANFANADIVGHTAQIPATVKACEAVDTALSQIIPLALRNNWNTIITADHGNAEMLIDPETGGPHTAHTLNPVPFILVAPEKKRLKKQKATLLDIAPTILELLKIDKPHEMTGKALC